MLLEGRSLSMSRGSWLLSWAQLRLAQVDSARRSPSVVEVLLLAFIPVPERSQG